jgi:hypothetical protein
MSDLNHMMCLDIFLIQSSEREQARLKKKVRAAQVKGHPLQCWDVAAIRLVRHKKITRTSNFEL